MEDKIREIAVNHVDAWCNDNSGTLSMYDVVQNAVKEAMQLQAQPVVLPTPFSAEEMQIIKDIE